MMVSTYVIGELTVYFEYGNHGAVMLLPRLLHVGPFTWDDLKSRFVWEDFEPTSADLLGLLHELDNYIASLPYHGHYNAPFEAARDYLASLTR